MSYIEPHLILHKLLLFINGDNTAIFRQDYRIIRMVFKSRLSLLNFS